MSILGTNKYSLFHTFQEDLRGHGTTLEACSVPTFNWCRVVDGCWSTRHRGLISQCMVVTCTFVSLNLWTPLACGVLGTLGIGSKCSLPMFSDTVQIPSRQLWLSLHVESPEETLPYRLQWLLRAPEHPIQIRISTKWPLVNLNVC